MALTVNDLRAHSPSLPDTDEYLERLLSAATAYMVSQLGFAIDDTTEFPDGTPADVEQAVLMLAAHFCENREASLVGVTAQEVPFGVAEVIRNHRTYTYG